MQTILIKDYIVYYQKSLSILIFKTVALLAKETELLVYKNTLLYIEIYLLYIANKVFSKCCRAKKTYICQEGVFIIEDIYNILSQTEIDKQIWYDRRSRRRNQGEENLTVQCYGTCRETGHNSRICQDTITVQSLIDPQLV